MVSTSMASSAPGMIRDSVKSLNGTERVAVVLLALGEERSAKMMAQMDDDEIRNVSKAMASLGRVSSKVVEDIFKAFAEKISDTGAIVGSYESTERFLRNVLPPDKVAMMMDEIRGPAGRNIWEKLGNVNEHVLATYLKNEYPQTVAVVLSRVKQDHAARVLTLLPPALQIEVVQRMIQIETLQRGVIDDIEATLRSEFMTNLSRTHGRDSHVLMAEIFNRTDKTTVNRLLEQLDQTMGDSAAKIRKLMFTFDDLADLTPTDIQTVIRACETQQLAMALKGVEADVKKAFFANMSERQGRMMQEEIDALGQQRVRDVEDAQAEIIKIAKRLDNEGEINLPDANDTGNRVVG